MNFEPTREFMITNKNLNTIIKPNNIDGEYTVGGRSNMDVGVSVLQGKVNHHFAMVIDIIYDHMYRLFNENKEMNFIEMSLRHLLNNGAIKKDYTTKLITDSKLDFIKDVENIGKYYERCKKEGTTVPFTKLTKDTLLYGSPHFIQNAFPPDFYIPYMASLESECEKEGTLDKPLRLLSDYNVIPTFFKYLLTNIFDSKYPMYNDFNLKIDLNKIFENGERTIYVIKKWFEDANNLNISMTYPVNCFSDDASKQTFWKPYMMAIPEVKPIASECNKSKMEIEVSLKNKFMVYMANDARMCVGSFLPSSLYTLNSNAYFIGKAIINGDYFSRHLKKRTNKLQYTIDDMFEFLNLPRRDINNGNNSHRRKAIFKALKQLDGIGIIKLDRMNDKEIVLSDIWSVSKFYNDEELNSCKD